MLIGQVRHTVDPATEYDPAVQFTHTLAPAPAEYVPAVQLMHVVVDVGVLLYLMITMPGNPLPPLP